MGCQDARVVNVMSKITPDDVVINFMPVQYTYVGGSAGAVLFISIVSLVTGAKVIPWVAMTGEIGLR